ncbi:GNAT family N-acetyltransferase [Streptomyces sp. TP-A0874]|uniref:GNAT family N-acetyltransferase n=1 Tax=Streptomyces sp. TP-A0874 TaxID=549819 RepID=UPI000853931E|nr:GNAT family N-acetyltransferase [Streptomyces sp. TP-A0874]
MSLEVRNITEADLHEWVRAVNTGFLRPPEALAEQVEQQRPQLEPERTLGAFDSGHCVGTYRSFTQRLTVPGGGQVTSDAVSSVTVSPTHRRRGLLSRMLAADQARAKDRGDLLSTLIAAEYRIYGRHGFGPATQITEWRVDTLRSGLDPRWSGPEDGGRVELVDGADVRRLGPELHERLRSRRHGLIDRSERFWRLMTGDLRRPHIPWKEAFYAVYRSAEGRVDGLVSYTTDDEWEGKMPRVTARVRDFLADSPAAERALWHFLLSIDWVTRVESGRRAPDDLLPLLLPDPRAARVTTDSDYLWVRLLDVPGALEARSYRAAGSLVLDVHDPSGYAAGRFRLDAGPEGASCTSTTSAADLALSASDLAALYLGDESALRLAALGRVSEERAGAAARADLLLRTARRPWCPDMF